MANQAPDLASVLQALAAYGQEAQQHQAPSTYRTQQTSNQHSAHGRWQSGIGPIPQQRSNQARQAYEPTSPAINPASITEWPLGLRCVAEMAGQNPGFKPAIRKMIHDQRQHEQLWSKGLQELVDKQSNTTSNNKSRLADGRSNVAVNDDPVVKAYVDKVYGASAEMHKVMMNELKSLGVPFFGTHADCIGRGDGSGGSPSRISEGELLALRRKMVQYLEDMYG